MNYTRFAMVSAALVMTSCASKPTDPVLLAAANRQITCSQGADCDAKWSRAVQWVLVNSSWKIQVQTDQMIQTFGPGDSGTNSAFVITKAANMSGSYDINFRSACGNPLGCFPSSTELRASFNNAVIGAPGTSQVVVKPPAAAVHFGIQFVNFPPNSASPAEAAGTKGVMIAAVERGSVAERAGVIVGDILYAYDSRLIGNIVDLQREVSMTSQGKLIAVGVFRGGQDVKLQVQF